MPEVLMGAGSFPAGAGHMGADPQYVNATVQVLARRALKYDPSVKQFVLTDAGGNQIDVHPIDQIVAVRATYEVGQAASNPNLGQRVRRIWARMGPNRYQAAAFAEVARIYKDLTDAGDMRLIDVTVTTTPANGANVVVISYVNLRDPNVNARFPTANTVDLSV